MNCKPGDIAMCVAGEFAGAVCEIIAVGPTYTRVATGIPMAGWLVEFPREMTWADRSGAWSQREGWYPDAWLTPIRPDPQAITRDETLTA